MGACQRWGREGRAWEDFQLHAASLFLRHIHLPSEP